MEDREYLEKQYAESEVMDIGSPLLQVISVVPKNITDQVPLVLVPGFAANAETFKENIFALALLGRHVLCVSAPHGIKTNSNESFPEAELKKVAALYRALEVKGFSKVDVVAHSEGAINTVITATLHPERFRNIILINPAGLIGKEDITKLATDFGIEVWISEVKRFLKEPQFAKPVFKSWLEAGRAIVADPVSSLAEAKAISTIEIEELLKDLNKKGIGVAVIHAKDDQAFPAEKVCSRARAGNACEIILVDGLHNEFYLQPEKFAKLTVETLTKLLNRQK